MKDAVAADFRNVAVFMACPDADLIVWMHAIDQVRGMAINCCGNKSLRAADVFIP